MCMCVGKELETGDGAVLERSSILVRLRGFGFGEGAA